MRPPADKFIWDSLTVVKRPTPARVVRPRPVERPKPISFREHLRGLLLDWDEAEHPRDDDGKFTDKGAGAGHSVQHQGIVITSGKHAADAERLLRKLKRIPDHVLAEGNITAIHTSSNAVEMAQKIDDYLLRNYGIDAQGQAAALVDKDTRTVFAHPDEAVREIGRLYEHRYGSKEWKAALRDYIIKNKLPVSGALDLPESRFATMFAELFTGHIAKEIMSITNPLGLLVEHGPVKRLLHRWGWKV